MEKLYTKNEIAQYLRVSVRTVDRILQNPGSDYKIYRIGRQIRIPESVVREMLAGYAMSIEELDDTITGFFFDLIFFLICR